MKPANGLRGAAGALLLAAVCAWASAAVPPTQALQAGARAQVVVEAYGDSTTLPDWQAMMSDGSHPRPELYRLKAAQDFRVIAPLVRRLLAGSS